MTGDKENIRNITDNWDKFVEIDFPTHTTKNSDFDTYTRQKTVTFFHPHNFNLCKVVTSNTHTTIPVITPVLHYQFQFKKLTTYY